MARRRSGWIRWIARRQGNRAATRAAAPGRARRHRGARLRRHPDRRRRRPRRDQPGAGHLLLQDPRPAAHRGVALLRGQLVAAGTQRLAAIPTAAGRLHRAGRDDLPARHGPGGEGGEANRVAALAGPEGALPQALPRVAAVRHKFDERWRQTIETTVRDGQDAGEFAASVNARATSRSRCRPSSTAWPCKSPWKIPM